MVVYKIATAMLEKLPSDFQPQRVSFLLSCLNTVLCLFLVSSNFLLLSWKFQKTQNVRENEKKVAWLAGPITDGNVRAG